ncbi:MAG TPA: T9SS type B sorting domain-containing protein [Taishania sp.]|nr:T9SS type B sorting domain-containing protein [Taishania sp.]
MKQLILFLTIALSCSVGHTQEISHDHSIHHSFIENKGQWDPLVLFKSKFEGGNLWIQQNKFVFHLQDFSELYEAHVGKTTPIKSKNKQQVVHFNFVNSNKVTQIEKTGETEAYYNYFIGNDRTKWASGVKGYSEAKLYNLYDGIDLKLIENELHLKYEFYVRPQVDPNQIIIDIAGADKLQIDQKGNLLVYTQAGRIIEEKPYAYQVKNGKIIEVPCEFKLTGTILSFNLGKFDPSVELVIDPTLIFATYSGAITDNFGMTATYAYDGSAYSGGTIYGNNYPTPDLNAYDITSNFTVTNNPGYGITDVFISKYSPDGTTMLWTTFLGGGNGNDGTETVHSLIADKDDNLYLYGATSSLDFPIVNGYQSTHAGGTSGSNYYYNGVYYNNNGTDIFVAKLSANGHNLLGSTYIGGSGNDGVNYKLTSGNYGSFAAYDSLTNNYGDQFRGEVMLDQFGNCIVASCTRSTNFPTKNAFQPNLAGGQDGVIFKLSSDLSSLLWSSYYGGTNNDACYSVKVDSSYNVVVAGGTSSTNLPGTSGGWKSTYNGGKTDGFILKLTQDGQNIIQATYVGTSNLDQVFFVEIDRNDKIYAIGQSQGGGFPVVNSTYSNPNSSQFIAKFNENLTVLENSTVFGNGSSTINISPSAFMVDICGNLYVCGWGANILQSTPLSGMPITPDAVQATSPNGFDFYLFVLKRDFSDILYGSYLGGNQAQEHVDGGTSRFDKQGIVYQSACGGCGGYSDFPTTPGAHSMNNMSTRCNNLVFKFDFNLIPKAEFTASQTTGCVPFTVTFNNFSSGSDSYLWDFGNNDTTSVIFNPTITYTSPGTYVVNLYVTDSICLMVDSAQITIVVLDSIDLSTSANQVLCAPSPLTLSATTNGTASTYEWSTSPTFNPILNSNTSDSTVTVTPQNPTTYYVRVSNGICSKVDSIFIDFIGSSVEISGNDTLCLGQTSTLTATNQNPLIDFTYTWSPADMIVSGQSSNTVVINPTQSQYIYLHASSNTGCTAVDSIWISVGSIPDSLINATANPNIIPVGGTTTLSAQPSGYSYVWNPPALVDQPMAQQTNATLETSTLFSVSITDGICTKTDTVWVQVYPFVCDEPFVFVPNAFTPNGDGENDVLYVYGSMIQGIIFRIYDRWGELVFETTNRNEGWDGTFRGKLLDPDVYDYYLDVECVDGLNNIIKGNITLMR